MIEEWRAVVGHPGYEVSNHGRVRSLDRVKFYQRGTLTIKRHHKGKLLSPGTMASGHQFIVLGRKNGFCVHALVLTAFVGAAPNGMECCHWDDDPANNYIGNLRWGTRTDNLADYERNYGRPQLLRDGA
jgi:HNH endonuclease/NUMOD4 motif